MELTTTPTDIIRRKEAGRGFRPAIRVNDEDALVMSHRWIASGDTGGQLDRLGLRAVATDL